MDLLPDGLARSSTLAPPPSHPTLPTPSLHLDYSPTFPDEDTMAIAKGKKSSNKKQEEKEKQQEKEQSLLLKYSQTQNEDGR